MPDRQCAEYQRDDEEAEAVKGSERARELLMKKF